MKPIESKVVLNFVVCLVFAIPTSLSHACKTNAPLETNPLGCILGPEGDQLKVGPCKDLDGAKSPLSLRLRIGKAAVERALAHIRKGFGLDQSEVDSCIEATKLDFHDEAMLNRLRRALLSEPKSHLRNLTVVAGGSSVTAGHDNLYAQSYPFAFERAASCAFSAAGINLVVRNAALGANKAFPYGMCVQPEFGSDVDLVVYEVDAMMNLDGPNEWELAMRSFFNPNMFPNRPSFIHPTTGVSSRDIWGTTSEACRDKIPPPIAGNLSPNNKCRYQPCPECPSKFHYREQRDFSSLANLYSEFGTGAFAPLLCIAKHSDKWKFSGSYTIRAGKQLRQGKGWHFGPYGHKLFGDMLAFIYLKMFLQVITEVEAAKPPDLHGPGLMAWAKGYVARLPTTPESLPEPQLAKEYPALYLDSPQCATTFEPHQHLTFTDHEGNPIVPKNVPEEPSDDNSTGVRVRPGSDDLLGWAVLLAESSAELVDMRDYCSAFSGCPPKLQHRADARAFYSSQDVAAVANSGKWAVSIVENHNSRGEVQMGFTQSFGWKDRKYVLQGNNNSGTLKLNLHMKQQSTGFVLCGAPFCRRKDPAGCARENRIHVSNGLAIEMDGVDVSSKIHREGQPGPPDIRKVERDMCLWVGVELSPGPHTLGLRGTDDLLVNIGHIIWW